jgi:hypothetical protein
MGSDTRKRLAGFAVGTSYLLIAVCMAATVTPPSNLPMDTPANYNLIVPVVGQQESEWCWAACGQMLDNYVDPLPSVQQCLEANQMFSPSGPEPQPPPNSACTTQWSDCCANGSSCACNVGDGGNYGSFTLDASSTPGMPLTWDQLRYQIWVVNSPFSFGWNWYPCCSSHVQVVTGYATDTQGNQWVYVNNPSPVGTGDFECMLYDEWVEDTSNDTPYGAHTHEGDWFNPGYSGSPPQLLYNLTTNRVVPALGLTEAQAPNLAGTVISDRVVPFLIGGPPSVSGQIQERVVQETASGTLDFYYRVMNSGSSQGEITQLAIQNFGRATVALAYRPDSLGDSNATQAGRDMTGNDIEVYLESIAPGGSSHFILLMTNATASNDQGNMTVYGSTTSNVFPFSLVTASVTISTDRPTAVPATTAAIGACPAATQPLASPAVGANPPSAAITGLPKRLAMNETAAAKAAAQAALPRALAQGTVGSPIQVAEVPLDRVAAYDRIRSVSSQVRPLSGLIVPIRFADSTYAGVFLKAAGSRYVPVGLGEPNQTRLVVAALEVAAKVHRVAADSLALLRIPGLFLSFIARQSSGGLLLTSIEDEPTYQLRAGEEIRSEALLARLKPFAQFHRSSNMSPHATRAVMPSVSDIFSKHANRTAAHTLPIGFGLK